MTSGINLDTELRLNSFLCAQQASALLLGPANAFKQFCIIPSN